MGDDVHQSFEDFIDEQKEQIRLMGINFTFELESFLFRAYRYAWSNSRAAIKVELPTRKSLNCCDEMLVRENGGYNECLIDVSYRLQAAGIKYE